MNQLSSTQKKWLKSIHIVVAGTWVAIGLGMFFMHFIRDEVGSGDELYMLNRVSYFLDMTILTPSAILCLLTGLLYSHYTKWGYFKHKWIIFKWIVTVGIILLGTFYSGPTLKEIVNTSKADGLSVLNNPEYLLKDKIHHIIGLGMTLTLIVTIFISVFKPWGKKK